MAMAARWMGAHFNRPDFQMIDYDVYALCGDGCMMEGVTGEAASLAGHLKLSNLCWIYDNNHITIEGRTDLAFSEDVAARFFAYGWKVTRVADANDLLLLDRALATFRENKDRPTLIIVDSHIAYGAPHKQDSSAAHGEPLGEAEIMAAKRYYGWPEEAQFLVPPGVPEHFQHLMGTRGRTAREQWMMRFASYRQAYPELADALYRMQRVNCRMDGTGICRPFPRIRRGWREGMRPRRCSMPWQIECLGSSGARPTSRRPPRRDSPTRGPATSVLRSTAAATCTSGFENMPWGRS